jgi:hypothetical protein
MEMQKLVGYAVPACLLATYAGICWAVTQVNGDCGLFQVSCAVQEKSQAKLVPSGNHAMVPAVATVSVD